MNVAVVSGANKGIGFETARELGQLGFHVFLGSRDAQRGKQAAELLQSEGLAVEFAWLDLEDPTSFHALSAMITERYGYLDVLVNNAGVQIESAEWNVNTSTSIAMATLRRTFDINFFGLVELTQCLLPLLEKSHAARIVNLSSILGSLSMHATPGSNTWSTKTFAYNSSKAAVNAFTIHLAHALRDTTIKVNSAHPGWVQTDMGGEGATLNLKEGAETSIRLATLNEEGPSGGYFFKDKILPW